MDLLAAQCHRHAVYLQGHNDNVTNGNVRRQNSYISAKYRRNCTANPPSTRIYTTWNRL